MSAQPMSAEARLAPYVWEAPQQRGRVVYARSAVDAMEAHAAAATAALRGELERLQANAAHNDVALAEMDAAVTGAQDRWHTLGGALAVAEQERDAALAQLADFKEYAGAERALRQSQDAALAERTRERDVLQRHFDAAAPEHNLLELLDLYDERRREAEAEVARVRALLSEAADFGVFDCNEGMHRFDNWLNRIDAALNPDPELDALNLAPEPAKEVGP